MSDIFSYFLTDTSRLIKLECVEIDHPDFVVPLRFVRNDEDGIVVKHEDSTQVEYEYRSFEVQKGNTVADLDQNIGITFADQDDSLKTLFYAVDHTKEASFKYRAYREDNLEYPMIVLQTLNIISFNSDADGFVTFDASAEQLNDVRTGLIYTLDNYPLMRGAI